MALTCSHRLGGKDPALIRPLARDHHTKLGGSKRARLPKRRLMPSIVSSVCIALVFAAAACGRSEREEAQALMERIHALNLQRPFDEREAQLDALRLLSFENHGFVAARD